MNEFEIIELIRQRVALVDEPVATLLAADDCALLGHIQHQATLSVDTLIAGTHFPSDAPPALIGRRAMAICASDLAAMGANPRGCLLSLGLAEEHNHVDYISSLADAIAQATREFSMPLLGGNITKSESLLLSITVIGDEGADGVIDDKPLLSRAGAKAGEDIYVSGTLGDAAAGLNYAGGDIHSREKLGTAQKALVDAYYCPQPRLALGKALRGFASCCIDISDGLVADLMHLLEQSDQLIKAALMLEQLPYSVALKDDASAREREELALYHGDDYELLFTLPANLSDKKLAKLNNICPITKIGSLTATEEEHRPIIVGIDARGEEQILTSQKNKLGYQHF